MDEFVQVVAEADGQADPDGVLELEYARRERTRQRAQLDTGEDVAIKLPRGTVMRGGDRLATADGRSIRVVAAPEPVSTAHASDPELLAKVAYHLGNRHVWLQVGPGWVRYLADHVLDGLVRRFGLEPTAQIAPFEPEPGAYAGHAQSEARQHEH